METLKNYKAHLIVLALFLSLWAGCYYVLSGPDCVRTIDGAIHCECNFKSSSEWQKYKEDTHGAWEAVVFDNGYDPCKK